MPVWHLVDFPHWLPAEDVNIGVFLTKAVSALLLPPLNLVLLCALGLFLRRRWPRMGLTVAVLALSVLVVLSTPAGARLLLAPLESEGLSPASVRDSGAQAIVVLGGGRIRNAVEYGGLDSPAPIPLARLRYAAALHRDTGLPLLVSGGSPDGSAESEAALLARSLREDFSVPVKWVESGSDDTAQNAALSARILKQAGANRILLVTDDIHMRRARLLFEQAGLDVAPAPATLFSRELVATDFLPSGEGLSRSHYAMHEWIGIAWSRLRQK